MHELPITQSIVNISCEEAKKNNVSCVKEIRIKVGTLTGLVPDCIQYYFDIISKGTVAEGAKLEIERIPIIIKCINCSRKFKAELGVYSCPYCNSSEIKIINGNEFYIDSLEVE